MPIRNRMVATTTTAIRARCLSSSAARLAGLPRLLVLPPMAFPYSALALRIRAVFAQLPPVTDLKTMEESVLRWPATRPHAAGIGAVASGNHDGQFIGDYEYSEGAGDLEDWNGMTYEGQYGYYVTDDDPWILGWFRAAVDDSFMPEGQALGNLLHGHDIIGGEEHIHRH